MPKISYRCNRRGRLPSVATVAFCAAPRKVSFEDGHSDSDSTLSASGSSEGGTPLMPKLTTLRRPKSSLSLVEMARGVEDDNNNQQPLCYVQDPDENSHMLVSPIASTPLDRMEVSSTPVTPTSPWGYFVDMVMPLEEETKTSELQATQTHLIYHEDPCSCCTSCRRRRVCPYGDYKKQRRASLCFQSKTNHSIGTQIPSAHRSIPLPSSFRLAPRRQHPEPAEQLIGALDRLQVNS